MRLGHIRPPIQAVEGLQIDVDLCHAGTDNMSLSIDRHQDKTDGYRGGPNRIQGAQDNVGGTVK